MRFYSILSYATVSILDFAESALLPKDKKQNSMLPEFRFSSV